MFCTSNRGHHATRILVLLASAADDKPVTKQAIAESEDTTPGYVQQLMAPLQASGLVIGYRGKLGGFKLGRPAHTITVADVLRATEGDLRLAHCYDGEGCARIGNCPTRSVWMGATALLTEFFQQTTIAMLTERAREASATPESRETPGEKTTETEECP